MRGAARPIGFHLQGWACSPPCRRVWGATTMLWSAGRSTVTREALPAHFPTAHFPAKTAWPGNVRRFPESELISAQPATRQATDPICHLHNLAIRTQTPGPGRASHMTRRKCCRAKCIQCLSSGLSTNGTRAPRACPSDPTRRAATELSTPGESSATASGSASLPPQHHGAATRGGAGVPLRYRRATMRPLPGLLRAMARIDIR
jgi:hypothetical protein